MTRGSLPLQSRSEWIDIFECLRQVAYHRKENLNTVANESVVERNLVELSCAYSRISVDIGSTRQPCDSD